MSQRSPLIRCFKKLWKYPDDNARMFSLMAASHANSSALLAASSHHDALLEGSQSFFTPVLSSWAVQAARSETDSELLQRVQCLHDVLQLSKSSHPSRISYRQRAEELSGRTDTDYDSKQAREFLLEFAADSVILKVLAQEPTILLGMNLSLGLSLINTGRMFRGVAMSEELLRDPLKRDSLREPEPSLHQVGPTEMMIIWDRMILQWSLEKHLILSSLGMALFVDVAMQSARYQGYMGHPLKFTEQEIDAVLIPCFGESPSRERVRAALDFLRPGGMGFMLSQDPHEISATIDFLTSKEGSGADRILYSPSPTANLQFGKRFGMRPPSPRSSWIFPLFFRRGLTIPADR